MKDYIKREKVLEIVKRTCGDYASAWSEISKIKSEDVRKVTHGHWVGVFQDGGCSWSGKCSVCGVRNDIPHPLVANYCPNCGAKMDGTED